MTAAGLALVRSASEFDARLGEKPELHEQVHEAGCECLDDELTLSSLTTRKTHGEENQLHDGRHRLALLVDGHAPVVLAHLLGDAGDDEA